MALAMEIRRPSFPLAEPFEISRGVETENLPIEVSLTDEAGMRGRGEAIGVLYHGETQDSMEAQLEAVRSRIEAGVSREALPDILPAGGARCALDAALWDLEAKTSGISAFTRAGVDEPKAVLTAFTIGIRSAEAYKATAKNYATYPLLKIKVGAGDPLPALEAVRAGAPASRFIVDPNQAWSIDMLKSLAPRLVDLGVVLLEQPIPVGAEAGLDGYQSPIALCADELIDGVADLERARKRFSMINIKLEKCGGLTEALRLADAAEKLGFQLMVGCMGGSSLAMAPAHVLAQRCAFVDLDGPLLQASDRPEGLDYCDGIVAPPRPELWG